MEDELSGSIKFEIPEEESPNEEQASRLGHSKLIRTLLIVFSALFFIAIGIVGTIFYTNNLSNNQESQIISPTPSVENQQAVSQTPPPETQEQTKPTNGVDIDQSAALFQSSTLGIQFQYPKEVGSEVVNIKEEGNKVYVYMGSMSPQDGQSVEVFEKPATQNIEDAIRERFLTGKDPQKCFVTTEEYDPNIIYDKTASKFFISFPSTENDGMEEQTAKTEYCSPDYAETNGIRYFWYDSLHPTKYLFFSIGQYGIPISDDISWQDTVEITQ